MRGSFFFAVLEKILPMFSLFLMLKRENRYGKNYAQKKFSHEEIFCGIGISNPI